MKTLEIEVTNEKAMKLLLDLEELNLIKVVKEKTKLSTLRSQIRVPMSGTEINQQTELLRNEWKRDI